MYGLLIGSVTHGIADEVGDSQVARDVVTRLGGTGAMEQAFIAVAFNMLGMIAAACAISLTLRMNQEESAGRAESVLAGSVSRTRWLASHLMSGVAGSGIAMLIAGLVTGLTYGVSADDVAGKLPVVLGTAVVQLPAVWLLIAVTVALFGALPRYTAAAWGILVAVVAVFLMGSLANAPHWLVDLEPFTHVPHVGTGGFTAAPLGWLLVIDVALIALGAIAFRRRDLR